MNKNYAYLNQAHAEAALDQQRELIAKELSATVAMLLDKGYNPITVCEELANRCGTVACITSAVSNYSKPMAMNVLREMLMACVNNMTETYDELKKEVDKSELAKRTEKIEKTYEHTYWKPEP